MHISGDANGTTPSQGTLSSDILDQLGLAAAPVLRSNSVRAPMTMTRLRSAAGPRSPRVDLPHEDGWEIRLHLRDVAKHRLWIDDQPVPVMASKAGTVSFYNLTCRVAVGVVDPIDDVRFFLPRTALAELSEELGSRQEVALRVQHGTAINDSVLGGLAASLLPIMERPRIQDRLLVDHVALAVRAHVASAYGTKEPVKPFSMGGLAGWQERRAKEMIETRLDSDISLADLSTACGLSSSHFSRAFRRSTGQPPHRWLLHRRIARAKDLLAVSHMTLAEIALACGFADQSHLGRMFLQVAGMTPGAWRRWRRAVTSMPVPEMRDAA